MKNDNDLQVEEKQSASEKKLRIEKEKEALFLRRLSARFILIFFGINTLSVNAAIFLVGFGVMSLSETIILTLICEVIANSAAGFVLLAKFVFTNRKG